MKILQEKTNAALSVIGFGLPDLNAIRLPEVVYHYTDVAGFLGIISSGFLWATDYRFLNDSSELSYVFRLASEVVREEYLGAHSGLAGKFLDYAASAPPPYSGTPYYLCCFSELDNSLSQWRAYGGQQGFSLAFPGDITTQRGYDSGDKQNPGLTLLKVQYNKDKQKSYIRALINSLLELCESTHMKECADENRAMASFLPFFWGQLERASYRFKHPDFEVEAEWRLVAWGDVRSELYRPSKTIVPYTKFSIYSKKYSWGNFALPLRSVRCGPGSFPDDTLYALNRSLDAHGYKDRFCKRLQSFTPARM